MQQSFQKSSSQERKLGFVEYLRVDCGLKKGTVGHYTTALNTISCKLRELNLVKEDIYEISTPMEINAVLARLLLDPDFIKMNKVGNRMYSAGLKKYSKFAEGIVDFKPKASATGKLSLNDLHRLFLYSLGNYVESHSPIDEKPLMVKLTAPYNWTLKVYLFNCTNPPGARQAGEYKSQLILPGQIRGTKGSFEIEPGITTLIMGFASVTGKVEDGSFVIWELNKHMQFAYSANIQVSLDTLLRAYEEPVFAQKKRGNGEWIVVSRPNHLIEGIKKRVDVDIAILLEEL